MMGKYPSSKLAFLLLVFYFIESSYSQKVQTVTTPYTAQKIPIEILNKFVHKRYHAGLYNGRHIDLVYEITDAQVLIGLDGQANLLNVTQAVESDSPVVYELEDKFSVSSSGVHFSEGGGYLIAYDSGDNSIIMVWGQGLGLKQIDREEYPGVYVNIHVKSQDIHTSVRGMEGFVTGNSFDITNVLSVRQATCANGGSHVIEVAVAYDNTFCAIHSNIEDIASAYVQAAVNEANFVYERDTCISLALVHIEPHCQDSADPYSSLSTQDNSAPGEHRTQIIDGFASIWETSRTAVQRDIAIFFSGFEDSTSVRGVAYTGAMCRTKSFAWVEEGDISTLIHEIGHSLTASHGDSATQTGVMRASSFQGDPVFFSSFSINEITAFVDTYGLNGLATTSRDSTCLDSSNGVCDSTCPGSCIDGNCIQRYSASASENFVPCTPLELIYRCTKEEVRNGFSRSPFTVATDCPPEYDFVLETDSGINVFCCTPPTETLTSNLNTFEYSYVTQTLNYPDGTSETLVDYIPDTSQLESKTIMKSTLDPTCAVTTTIPPTTTTSTPVHLPSHTEPETQSKAVTCRASLGNDETLDCALLREQTPVITLLHSGGKSILRFEQTAGELVLNVYSGFRQRISKISGIISTSPGVQPGDYRQLQRYGHHGAAHATITADAFEMLDLSSVGCCDRRVYYYASITYCARIGIRISRNRCRTENLHGYQKIQCSNPCQGRKGSIKPFSKSRKCPSCRK